MARAGGLEWRRRHDGATERGRVTGRRGWAGNVNDDVEANQANGLVRSSHCGRGTGRVESCAGQKIPGQEQSRLLP